MSLKDIRSECTDVASMLQPYVDGELSDEERKHVGEHLEDCDPCMAAVSEQLWVRSTLRALETEPAPQSLRAGILLGLDEVDNEADAERDERMPTSWDRVRARARALLKGGLVMVPATAVAGVLFVAARGGLEDAAYLPGAGLASAIDGSEPASPPPPPANKAERDVTRTLSEIEPQVGFPVQVVDDPSNARIELVGARVDRTAMDPSRPAAHLRYRLLEAGRDTGQHVIDRQRPTDGPETEGTPVTFRGRRYLLDAATGGRPVVYFHRGGVTHTVSLEGPAADEGRGGDDPDFSHLLDVADQLARGSR